MEGDRWKKTRRRGGVDRDGNDDEWDGSESEREREQDAFERRSVVWAGNRLQIIMTSRNLRTYSLLASACLVRFQMVYMVNHCFFIHLCCYYREISGSAPGTSCFNQ